MEKMIELHAKLFNNPRSGAALVKKNNLSMEMVSFSLFVKKFLVLTNFYRIIFLNFTLIFLQQKEIDR
jgi:hypothetical protein